MSEQNPKQKAEDLASADGANPADPEYKVGPGKPPKEHQWKKGGPSPNPKGRNRKKQTLAPDLKKALEDALNTRLTIKQGDRRVILTKAVVGIEQLVNRFVKGERNALKDVMELATKLGVDLLAGQRSTLEQVLSPGHQAILDDYVSRQPFTRRPSPEQVIASPELREGIVTITPKTTRPLNRIDRPNRVCPPEKE
jgi:hypothetical protein